MKLPWKAIGTRARLRNWTPMAWAVLVLVLACTAGTVYVGIKLYEITGHPPPFNSR